MTDYLDEVFSNGGLLSQSSPDYKLRLGQLALSRFIDSCIQGEEHALAEGPCGTGKGIAYCVPAIYHAVMNKKRVVIATANLSLQDQLMFKDLPALQKALPWPFTFQALKGKSNYLCRDKFNQNEHKLPEELAEWGNLTATGDRRELPVVPNERDWALMSSTADECVRETCEHNKSGSCHYYNAKAVAEKANIIVTNIHVLGAHLNLFQTTGMELILPEFDVLIIDEAHETPDVMRNFFGFSVTGRSVTKLAKQVGKELGESDLAFKLEQASDWFFRDVADYADQKGDRVRLTDSAGFVNSEHILQMLRDVYSCARQREQDILSTHEGDSTPKAAIKAARIQKRAEEIGKHISECVGQSDAGNKVYWVEFADAARRFPRLEAKPLEVGGILKKYLFDNIASVILVSATLTTTPGNFRFMRRELGIPHETQELAVPSPFDTVNQCLVILPGPDKIPEDPNDADFIDKASVVVEEVLRLCNGRTLGLFTSFKNLEGIYRQVKSEHPILCQERSGGMSRAELVRRFRDEPYTSLFGVESFWTGIDVVGESLTGLIIDKLPFEHQDDPLVAAMKDKDSEEFWKWYNARAFLRLKQGVGRLIRSSTDVGVVVILDRRIKNKRYGKHMVLGLGPISKSGNVSDIELFLANAPILVKANRQAFALEQENIDMSPKRPPPKVAPEVDLSSLPEC